LLPSAALVLLFTLPKGYELKKKEVDALLDQVGLQGPCSIPT
jgi:hypothetical protein